MTNAPELHHLGGVELIAVERQRQIEAEGWTAEHDDEHTEGQIGFAAVCYVLGTNHYWPWWGDPKFDADPIRNLVKAGALVAAEIDRLQRLEQFTSSKREDDQ